MILPEGEPPFQQRLRVSLEYTQYTEEQNKQQGWQKN